MRRRFLLASTGFLLGLPAIARAAAPARLNFGIVPQLSARELARAWIPPLAWLAARSGLGLRFATAPDIPTFERRLAAGEYDFAYMNPYHYTVFAQKPGYRAFAKERNRRLRGVVVVRKDSPLKEMSQLAGRDIAFPAPAAFAATVLVRAELARLGISVTPRYVNSHESVYLNVMQGLFPAGGGIQRTLQTMEPAVRDQLRVLWSTRDYTPHAFAAHPRVPAVQVAALRTAMLEMADEARGRAVLQELGFAGFDTAEDADWADVRALGITTLTELLKG